MTATATVKCGDLIRIHNYEYADGGCSPSKYFVVMGFYKGCVIGFLTTSREKHGRTRKEGCHREFGNLPSNYYLKTSSPPLGPGTWILLGLESQELDVLKQRLSDGSAQKVLTFTDQLVRALRNCFEQSMDWMPVCATYMCGGSKPPIFA